MLGTAGPDFVFNILRLQLKGADYSRKFEICAAGRSGLLTHNSSI